MTTFYDNPEATAAELIARLPDDFDQLSIPQIQELADAHGEIARLMGEAMEEKQAQLDRIQPRVTSPDQTLGEVATEVEQAEMLATERRYLYAERAGAALDAWAERAGAARFGWPRSADREPAVMEGPDGTLLMRVR